VGCILSPLRDSQPSPFKTALAFCTEVERNPTSGKTGQKWGTQSAIDPVAIIEERDCSQLKLWLALLVAV
jgi:sporulation-control protein spo0M